MRTIINHAIRRAPRLAALSVLLLGHGLGSAAVVADEGVVAYAATSAPQQRASRTALGQAISGAAVEANAALTATLRSALDDRVRSKLQLAGAPATTRG
jgi:hypothetical protein